MSRVASELKQELERQALNDWSDQVFELVSPGMCETCCMLSSGGGPADMP